MTSRLETAIKKLSPEKLEELENFAEFLAQQNSRQTPTAPLDLSWVGSAAKLKSEFASGVDAAHAATDMMGEMLEQNRKGK